MILNTKRSSVKQEGRHQFLEPLLVLLVLSISLLMWRHKIQDPILLHLYYVPVVIGGFYLGSYRARLTSLLCVTTGIILFMPSVVSESSHGIPLATFLSFLLWSGTLFMVATLTGTLCDGLRSAMQENEISLKKDAFTDVLTGIANRRAFDYEVGRSLTQHKRSRSPVALVLVDIDFFKIFNDRYGHQAGDAILQQVARVFQQVVREGDLLARHGGEEFALVLPGLSADEATHVAERARALVEATRFEYQGLVMRLTVSVGVSIASSEDNSSSFCERADRALYTSKEAGRNCVYYHNGKKCVRSGSGFTSATPLYVEDELQASSDANAFLDMYWGVPTQRVFVEEVRRRVIEKQRYDVRLCVALIELRDYPVENSDNRELRKCVAATSSRLIVSNMRDSDLVSTWGEGTFGVIIPFATLEQALTSLRRVNHVTSEYVDIHYPGQSYDVNIAVSEAELGEEFGALIQRTKDALIVAKSAEKGSIVCHDGQTSQFVRSICDASKLAKDDSSTDAVVS